MGRFLAFFRYDRTKDSRRPVFLGWRSSKEFIIVTVAFGIFVDILLYSIVVPILPFALTERANVEEKNVQRWISVMLAVYGVGLLVASPIFGWVADHTKYRRVPFLMGLILLAASTAMFMVGNSIPVLVVARLIQGMSGGCIWVVGLALVIDTVPASSQMQSLGFVSIGMTAGSSLGPLLGGIIYDKAGYNAVFILAYAVIAFDIILRIVVIEKDAARQWLDEEPSTADNNGIAPTEAVAETSDAQPPQQQQAETASLASKAVGTRKDATMRDIMLSNSAVARREESKVPAIFLLLKLPRQLNALFVTVMMGSIFTAFDAVIPLHVKETFDFNPTAAGLIFLTIVVPSLFGPVAGWLTDRYGPRWFVVVSFFLAMPLFICLRLTDSKTTVSIVVLCILLFFIGLAVTVAMPGAMGEISASVVEFEASQPGIFGDRGAFAQAFALFNIAFSLGSVIGPVLGGFVAHEIGWKGLTLVMGMLCLLTSVVTIWYTGGLITKKDLRFWERKDSGSGEGVQPDVETEQSAIALDPVNAGAGSVQSTGVAGDKDLAITALSSPEASASAYPSKT